jgi:hypothetical protein
LVGGGIRLFCREGSGPPAAHVLDGAGGLQEGFFAAEGEDNGN